MAKKPHEYITPEGQVTTNSMKGFYGLALKHCSKGVDLHHSHSYQTNMAICHKVFTVTCEFTNAFSRILVSYGRFMDDEC